MITALIQSGKVLQKLMKAKFRRPLTQLYMTDFFKIRQCTNLYC